MATIDPAQTPHPSATPLSSPPALLERVLTFATVRSFHAGEPILAPGTATNAFYFLISGTVEVSYTDRADTGSRSP